MADLIDIIDCLSTETLQAVVNDVLAVKNKKVAQLEVLAYLVRILITRVEMEI